MATLTVRNLPDDLVKRIKAAAAAQHRSMEQEVRDLLRHRYAPRAEVLARVREQPTRYLKRSPADVIRGERKSR